MSSHSRIVLPLSILVAAMALSACGGGDDAAPSAGNGADALPAASTTVTGSVVKGPVAAAQVCGYTVAANARGAALGSCTTSDASGKYALTLPVGSGPLWLEATGGTYTDEITGTATSLPAGSSLRALVTANGGSVSSMLTPLTTLTLNAAAAAAGSGGTLDAAAFNSAAAALLASFKLPADLNISNTVPTFGSGINSYGTALTAISKMVANGQTLASILATAQPSSLAAAYATAAAPAAAPTPPVAVVTGQRIALDFSAATADFNGSLAPIDLAESASSAFTGSINAVTPSYFTATPPRQVQFTFGSPGGAGTALVVPGTYAVGLNSALFATVFYNEAVGFGWEANGGTVIVDAVVGDVIQFRFVNVRLVASRRFGSTSSVGAFTFNGSGNARQSCLTAAACATAAADPVPPMAGARAFAATGSLLAARNSHAALLLPGGKVMVSGGLGAGSLAIASAELYDPATALWTAAAPMQTARSSPTATLLPSGKVLVSGGQTSLALPTSIASAELYNPGTNTWATAGSLATGRSVHTATLLPSGKVLVAGGLNNAASASNIATAELYDPATNAWTSAGAMSAPRYSHTATLLPNGKVLVVGGLNSATYATLASAELYDPSTNSWTTVNPMAGARYLHTAALLANGKLLVMGGSGLEGATFATFKTAELYDPAANAWSAAAPMAVARVSHTATLLPGDKVLVTGGFTALSSAEIYDAATNTWAPTGLMTAGRHAHAATLLNNGKVLISAGSGSAPAGAELF